MKNNMVDLLFVLTAFFAFLYIYYRLKAAEKEDLQAEINMDENVICEHGFREQIYTDPDENGKLHYYCPECGTVLKLLPPDPREAITANIDGMLEQYDRIGY